MNAACWRTEADYEQLGSEITLQHNIKRSDSGILHGKSQRRLTILDKKWI